LTDFCLRRLFGKGRLLLLYEDDGEGREDHAQYYENGEYAPKELKFLLVLWVE
jgi:hypothetical protein